MNRIALTLPKTANDHAKRLVAQMGERFNELDSDVAACYGLICQTIEELPSLDLSDKDRVALQAKLVTTLGTLRRSMGLTSDERRKDASGGRIGRPPKNSTWEGMDV